VNSGAYADESGNVIATASDDMTVRIWDRRLISNSTDTFDRKYAHGCVGIFQGHCHGLTHVESKKDGVYFLTNSKDQTMKLWDIRTLQNPSNLATSKNNYTNIASSSSFSSSIPSTVPTQPPSSDRSRWDYRSRTSRPTPKLDKDKNDTSITTYYGHHVCDTLIKCHFSPSITTAQQFIIVGCHTGCIYIFDILTAKILAVLKGHQDTVRDIAWHPFETTIASASWDQTLLKFNHIDKT
jgi:WD repeat-containing protein 23